MRRITYRVDRRGHVDVDPGAGEVEAEVGSDEEAGARHERVAAILSVAAARERRERLSDGVKGRQAVSILTINRK